MAKKANVKVVKESDTGLNEKVSVNGKTITNTQAYNEAKKGNINGYVPVKNANGTKYIRSKPDGKEKNNLG